MSSLLNVEHLSKVYGERIATKDVTFSLDKGQICAFLGPNGAGKSTTMNMITGYLSPSSGLVEIDGVDMVKNPSKAKSLIGYLPEIPPVYIDMTVLEYLEFAAELKGVKKIDRKAEIQRVIDKAVLNDVKERLIKNLSKGYRQRVGLAQALLGNPPILILDEPTVGLDPKQIVEIRNLIKELKENHLVILSTHILSEAEAVCDKIIIISHGHIVADNTPENLIKEYNDKQKLKLEIKGNSSNIEVSLGKLSDKIEFHILSEQGGVVVVNATALNTGEDVREAIATRLTEDGLLILEQSTKVVSLEDIYLELTGDDHYEKMLLAGVNIKDDHEEAPENIELEMNTQQETSAENNDNTESNKEADATVEENK